MLFAFWQIIHFLFVFISRRRYGVGVFALMSLMMLSLYIAKDPTYDLIVYIDNISNDEYYYEPVSNFFLYIVNILSCGHGSIYSSVITLLLFILHLIGLMELQAPKDTKYDNAHLKLLASCVILGSLYFFLGSQNVIRQCLSIAFFILTVSQLQKKKYIFTLFFLTASAFSHYGNFPIVLLMIIYLQRVPKISVVKALTLGVMLGLAGVWTLSFSGISTDYLMADFSVGEGRTSLLLKWLYTLIITSFTTFLLNFDKNNSLDSLYWIMGLRCFLLGFLTSIFIFDFSEMFSRVAVNLYALDMILLFLLVNKKEVGRKNLSYLTIAILVCSPAFALNVFQILAGV